MRAPHFYPLFLLALSACHSNESNPGATFEFWISIVDPSAGSECDDDAVLHVDVLSNGVTEGDMVSISYRFEGQDWIEGGEAEVTPNPGIEAGDDGFTYESLLSFNLAGVDLTGLQAQCNPSDDPCSHYLSLHLETEPGATAEGTYANPIAVWRTTDPPDVRETRICSDESCSSWEEPDEAAGANPPNGVSVEDSPYMVLGLDDELLSMGLIRTDALSFTLRGCPDGADASTCVEEEGTISDDEDLLSRVEGDVVVLFETAAFADAACSTDLWDQAAWTWSVVVSGDPCAEGVAIQLQDASLRFVKPDCDEDGVDVADGDCDDVDSAVYPGAEEYCDDIDQDCDGEVADDESVDAPTWYTDADGDDFGDLLGPLSSCTAPSGHVEDATDCDDGAASVHPGATETCNGEDDDCDGTTDEDDADDALSWYRDADADGFGDPSTTTVACTEPAGWVADATDCDDAYSTSNPAATEYCDTFDNDCDGTTDEADAADAPTWYLDADGDSYGNSAVTAVACSAPVGYVSDATDCDDTRGSSHPGATESCNSIDDDCDGTTDEGVTHIYYVDADGDGYGNSAVTTVACSAPAGYVADYTDCDDTLSGSHPGATESCNSIDDDCDGTTDEGVTPTYYADADADGYGDSAVPTAACSAPADFVSDATDCDDDDPDIHPGATESCNSVDDDCDGTTDEGVTHTYYADIDDDGYGNSGATTAACSAPAGYVSDATDCDDTRSSSHPGAYESCNSIDDDCDGTTDEGVTHTYYADTDGDGYGNSAAATAACSAPTGYVSDATDCDDTDSSVNPAASESCLDSEDNDCDGTVDEGCTAPNIVISEIMYNPAGSEPDQEWFEVYNAGTSDEDLSGLAVYSSGSSGHTFYVAPGELTIPASGYVVFCHTADYVASACDYVYGSNVHGTSAMGVTYDSSFTLANSGVRLSLSWSGTLLDEVVYSSSSPWPTNSSGYGISLEVALLDATSNDTGSNWCHGTTEYYGGHFGTPGDQNDPCILDEDMDGYDTTLDCDDSDASVYPGGSEICDDRVDNNCDGSSYPCGISGTVDLSLSDSAMYGGSGDAAGFMLATGDTNGDGVDDVLIGAPADGAGGSMAGAAFLVRGPAAATEDLTTADATIVGETSGDWAGYWVGTGDVNGDGFADIIVGARYNDAGGSDAGAAYVVLGPVLGTRDLSTASSKLLGEAAGDWAGFSVAGGDTDDDGIDDVLVGAYYQDAGGTDAGAAYIVRGPVSSSMNLSSADARLAGELSGDHAGRSVGWGDVNGDGVGDLLVGATSQDSGGSASGAAYVVWGPASGTLDLSAADLKLVGEAGGDSAGMSVAAEDVDGDGIDEVLIGASGADAGGSAAGAAYSAKGTLSGTVDLSSADAKLVGENADDHAGQSIGGGDVDGDGVGDFLIGAIWEDSGGSEAGAAYVVIGPVVGTVDLSLADAKLVGEDAGDCVGYSVTSGDIDGDGTADILAGAPGGAGVVYLILGTGM